MVSLYDKILFTGFRIGTLYYATTNNFSGTIEDMKNKLTRVSLTTWHERLGHLHLDALKELPVSTTAGGKLPSNLDCEVCIQSKMQKRPFPDSSR